MKTLEETMKNLICCLLFTTGLVYAAEPASAEVKPPREGWILLFGLNQPIVLHGGNVEINYLTRNWVFEYSHGFLLNLSPNRTFTMTQAERDQNLDISLPFSTGGGIGYRFTDNFNLRAEVKAHRYEVNRGSVSFAYTTWSVGLGAYYYWYPFGKEHFVVTPSLRFWPNVASTLDNGEYRFADGQAHRAHDFSLFANVSVGYRF
jgi:hypothetical protein